jgi:hypothetical protein
MSDTARFTALGQLQHTSRKILELRWLGVAIALPPDDDRRMHYKRELEKLLGNIDNDRDACVQALRHLERDEPKWRREEG